MDTNRIFTNLLGGWLTVADKAAAITINCTQSTVLPCESRGQAPAAIQPWTRAFAGVTMTWIFISMAGAVVRAAMFC